MTASMLNALTFDVEEHFHVHAFADVIARDRWDDHPSRVVESTQRILEILRAHQTRATFFLLGCVAERHPHLVREIEGDGHELASHGYAHEAVDRLTRAQFREDVLRSLEVIGQACPGTSIRGYRAPSFSINQRTPWAFEVLAELGFVYDSSISPVTFHDRYGLPSAPRFSHRVAAGLLEIPVSTIRCFGCNWPVAGGGYFRFLPLTLTKQAIRHLNRRQQPSIVYLHPWEFDPQQPRIERATWKSRFRHYVNLSRTEVRLRRLLGQFSFGPIRDVFSSELSQVVEMDGRVTMAGIR